MSNLLPAESQKRTRGELRARFLLAASLILFGCAAVFALALTPAEVAVAFFSPPSPEAVQGNINSAQDSAAIASTKALLVEVQPFATTTSLAGVADALSKRGTGVTVTDISYSPGRSLTLAGSAQTPDEVNAFREALQGDPSFSDVSVPVSALIGSQGGSFTITMNLTQ